MKSLQVVLTLGLILLLISCTSNNDTSQNSGDVNYNLISADTSIDQSIANQAKKSISQRNAITAVNAVNTNKKLIVAFEIEHNKRFQLADINKEIQTKMEKEFPKMTVEVSSDKRLVLEIEKLEEKIDNQDVTKKKLKKEVDRLIKLSKDKT
ncbi:YhcN/YlaJ family sporulation lipoprotein [Lentibacillus sp.]|uniref:YhcN/YlaJ family sporulation lipoprotein n=1 Tax=Lentibacillus sp. TaxID=1925746 RepID=UPI002B4B51D1|nr:YhcN/YlaJ family sporulation lipoprotein [Lentibacillus sp.]HLS10307.1 YhcN/YlaJ family sporulation lipoprotein [Lentibacillus sp.]